MRKLRITSLAILMMLLCTAAAFAETKTVDKDETITEPYIVNEDLTVKGEGTLTLEHGAEVNGNLIVDNCTVKVPEGGIKVTGDILITNANMEVQRSTYGYAISSEKAIIAKNCIITANAVDRATHAICGKAMVQADNCQITANTGEYGVNGINSDGDITLVDCMVKSNVHSQGISAYRGNLILENVKGNIVSGSSGLSAGGEPGQILLKNCGLNIDAGGKDADAGLQPTGIFAYDTITIDGGTVTVKSPKNDGIYANHGMEITNNTNLVDATGKENGLRVLVNQYTQGKIVIGSGLVVSPEKSGFSGEEGVFLDKSGNKCSHIIIKKIMIPPAASMSIKLKSVKVKRSAKKLVLQATLKINEKAAKNKKVTFKFNGKKYTAKTNKKGIAKVTIKKKVLKKLKAGKKVKYSATYSTVTDNKTAKVKK